METINSIGFVNFWGVTPAHNILSGENIHEMTNINFLISNSNDIRHILKTVSLTLEHYNNIEESPALNLNFYILETHKENLARAILLLHILHDKKISIRDRVEILMDIYGNTLNSSRTAEYISTVYKELIRLVTADKKYTGILNELIDFSLLNHRDKDDLIEIFAMYDLKHKFEVEKYREDRLRYMYKDRYDCRENLVDWDFQMNLREFAPVVKQRHYLYFRESGVSFLMRTNKYNIANRTLSSYIPGRDKKSKDSCLVRGFWGDLVNSPYIPFGISLDTEEEQKHFYSHVDVSYKYHEQEITEFNLIKVLLRLEKNQNYDFVQREKERRKRLEKMEEKNESAEVKDKVDESPEDISLIDESDCEKDEVLTGFKKFNVKIYLMTGDTEALNKKKRFTNLFNFILLGFHSKNIMNDLHLIGKDHLKVFVELNSCMASFKIEERKLYRDKLVEKMIELYFLLEESQDLKGILKFKKNQEKDKNDPIGNNLNKIYFFRREVDNKITKHISYLKIKFSALLDASHLLFINKKLIRKLFKI